ncbi:MAG: aldo/keto reductase [Candidatus Hydrogenedentota bacterium]
MKYVQLGKAGIRVPEICLGTMTFGNEADDKTSFEIMDRAAEAGVNFFDTADIYSQGRSEEIIGAWMRERREEIVVATKVHYPTGPGPNERGSSRVHILRGVHQSLRRLQTDHIDILYLHHWDAKTPLDESLAAMDDLVRAGKVLYCGVSNFSAWQTIKAIDLCAARDWASIVVIQPQYSLVKRIAEVEILPMALHEGVAVCPYSPMGAGLLTGKYQRKETGRISTNAMYIERFKDPQYMDTSNRFVAYAEKRGVHPATLCVAWVLAHPAVTSPIIGARNIEQLELGLAATDVQMSAELYAEISALSPMPPLATDRERTAYVPFGPKTK